MTDDKREWVAELIAHSRYAMPASDAAAHIAQRRRDMLKAPTVPDPKHEPESYYEPLPDPPPPPPMPAAKPPPTRGKPKLTVIAKDE